MGSCCSKRGVVADGLSYSSNPSLFKAQHHVPFHRTHGLLPKAPPSPVPLPPPPPLFESAPHPPLDARPSTPPHAPPPPRCGLQAFSYGQLAAATGQFSEACLLGEGGFGKVYKGFLPPTRGRATAGMVPVAVKKLNETSVQGHQEWLREICVLGRIMHPNLVLLLGYCDEYSERMLVYEFVALGSLDYHLFPEPRVMAPLPWQRRVQIALQAAQGLAHLHRKNIIHRDFKAPNILLDEHFCAKLTDFGMAKDGPQGGHTHVSTAVMGTMGYLDPRYAETGRLTQKSDVFAFGVLLLELLSGRRAMGTSPTGRPLALTNWARPHLAGPCPNLVALVDPHLREPFPEQAAMALATAATMCVQEDPKLRPEMLDMVDFLSGLEELPAREWSPAKR